ncbi:MAG TPA: hypothetical protein VFV28_04030 [Limnobacter sp.]|nr:hypothetical protein [Limnobacter sp.]
MAQVNIQAAPGAPMAAQVPFNPFAWEGPVPQQEANQPENAPFTPQQTTEAELPARSPNPPGSR